VSIAGCVNSLLLTPNPHPFKVLKPSVMSSFSSCHKGLISELNVPYSLKLFLRPSYLLLVYAPDPVFRYLPQNAVAEPARSIPSAALSTPSTVSKKRFCSYPGTCNGNQIQGNRLLGFSFPSLLPSHTFYSFSNLN